MRTTARRIRAALCAASIAAVVVPFARAQDTQYWSDAYGTQARLMGGIVIGGDADISAVYYNPGAIALADSLQLLISLNALRYASLGYSIPNVQNVPSSTGWSALSNMFAGTIPIGGKDSNKRLAFSLLTRQSFVFGAQLRAIALDSFIPVPPPAPTFSQGNAVVNQSLGEVWTGATYSWSQGRHWGFGGSLYIPIRSQTWSQSVDAQVVNGVGKTALAIREYDFSYYNWALLAKLGVQWRGDDGWYAGLTLTTPRLNLFGGSSVGATASYVDQGVTGGPGSSQIATNYQTKLGAHYNSATSIGFGVSKVDRDRKWVVNLAAEWFSAVPRFTIIRADSFVPQTGGPAIPMSLTAQYRAVFDWGVSARRVLSEHFDIYGAFKTDNTSIPPGVKSVGTLVNWDLLHADAGVQGTLGRVGVILGFDFAWGSHAGLTAGGDPAPGLPALPNVSESFFAITGALGFKFTY